MVAKTPDFQGLRPFGTPVAWGRHVAVTNSIPLMQASTSLTNAGASSPDLGGAAGSLFRLTGSLALVFAVLIGVVWMYRQWQRVMLQRAPVTGLRILDVKNLGQRTSLYVVAYRQQQFLIGGSSNGLNLLSTLDSDPSEGEEGDSGGEADRSEPPAASNAFRNALDQVLDKARSSSK